MNTSFPQMALCISSTDEINRLTHLNGVSIEEIEEKAHPKHEFDIGQLAKNESLTECLKTDWQTVAKLGKTHIEIAAKLRELWDDAPMQRDCHRNYGNYCTSIQTLSAQANIFFNPANSSNRESWNRFLCITDRSPPNEAIHLIGEGAIDQIEHYGFYGGNGIRNLHRIDPEKLIATLYSPSESTESFLSTLRPTTRETTHAESSLD